MNSVRIFSTIVSIAALAACSGNLGGGQSTLPGAPQSGTSNVQSVAQAAPTSTPVSASNVATLSDTAGSQPLPEFDGWGGTIAFAAPSASPTPTPNPKSTATAAAFAAAASAASIGITTSVADPSDAPRFAGAGKHRSKHDAASPTALFFITLMATSDTTLAQYPHIAIDVPRDVAAKYHGDTYGLALYDPDTKSKAYRLDVAVRDLNAPQTGSLPPPTPVPSPSPSPSSLPFAMPGGPGAPPTSAPAIAHSSLPPQEIAFLPTASTLNLHENQPVYFAFYVVAPAPSPSPLPSPKTSPSASPSPAISPPATASPVGSAAPSASPSPLPIASPK